MPTTKTMPSKLLVKKVQGGYQVHYALEASPSRTVQELRSLNEKVYFHPTSAYAAMGRAIHTMNMESLKIEADPAKAPAKPEPADAPSKEPAKKN